MATTPAPIASTLKNAVSAAATAISSAMKVSVKVTSFGAKAGNTIGTGAANMARAAAEAAAANAKKKAYGGPQQGGSGRTGTIVGTQKTQANNILLKWCDIAFYANANEVRGFRDLTISASCETEDEEQDGEKYAKLKNKKGFEISLKAFFDKRLGISDVKGAAMKIENYATIGQSGYFYAQNTKLVSTNMMLTSAKAQNIQMTPSGAWISAEVQMTLKSCSKLGDAGGGGSSGGGGGGGGGSSKTAAAQNSFWKTAIGGFNQVADKQKEALNKVGTALKQLASAKTASAKTENKTGVTARAEQVAGAKNNKTKPISKNANVLPQ